MNSTSEMERKIIINNIKINNITKIYLTRESIQKGFQLSKDWDLLGQILTFCLWEHPDISYF